MLQPIVHLKEKFRYNTKLFLAGNLEEASRYDWKWMRRNWTRGCFWTKLPFQELLQRVMFGRALEVHVISPRVTNPSKHLKVLAVDVFDKLQESLVWVVT